MEKFLSWLDKHRLRVVSHLEEEQRNPSKAWWVMIFGERFYRVCINKCYIYITSRKDDFGK